MWESMADTLVVMVEDMVEAEVAMVVEEVVMVEIMMSAANERVTANVAATLTDSISRQVEIAVKDAEVVTIGVAIMSAEAMRDLASADAILIDGIASVVADSADAASNVDAVAAIKHLV
jgi:predicted RNA-binding protein